MNYPVKTGSNIIPQWRWMILAMVPMFPPLGSAQSVAPIIMLDVRTRPSGICAAELAEFAAQSESRRRLIKGALALVLDSPWLPYRSGGARPEDGGLDCSGAMYYVMRRAGLKPPRSSGAQMEWLKSSGRLHVVHRDAVDMKHASLASLTPGDLLFWAVDESGVSRVHHVAMYLGTEKKDGRPVMINSTDGRSYRGQKANGYGVYDFRVPKPGSRSKLTGYGPPPGIGME